MFAAVGGPEVEGRVSSRSSLHPQRVPDSLGGEGVDQTDLLDPGGDAQEASVKYEGRKGQGEEDTSSRLTSKVCGEKGKEGGRAGGARDEAPNAAEISDGNWIRVGKSPGVLLEVRGREGPRL